MLTLPSVVHSGVNQICVIDWYAIHLDASHSYDPFVEVPIEAVWPSRFILLHLLSTNSDRRVGIDITGNDQASSNIYKDDLTCPVD